MRAIAFRNLLSSKAMVAAADFDDDDLQREMDAAHSVDLSAFLRHPIGYRGLLGLDQPPTTICHPFLSELSKYPISEHARLVREAMQACGSSDGPPS